MTIKRRYLPPMLLAAAAASIATVPAALAEQSCTYLSADSTICQTPGNAQIVDALPPVQYAQQVRFSATTCSSSTMAEITRNRWGTSAAEPTRGQARRRRSRRARSAT
jgi:hypothetical protein